MTTDTVLRTAAHKCLDEALDALLWKHDPASEGVVNVVVSLCTETPDGDKTVYYDYTTELIPYNDTESWEVEEQVVHLRTFIDNDNIPALDSWQPFGEL